MTPCPRKRFWAFLALAPVLACSGTTTPALTQLGGPNSVVLADRHMWVATTTGADVRTFSLDGSRVFERAPNPLWALAVPTAPYPRSLAAFTSFTGLGTATVTSVAAPLAFALSTATSQVSVLSVGQMAWLGDLALDGAVPLSAAVTPWAPSPSDDPSVPDPPVQLVLGVTAGSHGEVWMLSLSQTEALLPDTYQRLVGPAQATPIDLGDGSIPQALVASPSSSGLVAVGDRNPTGGALALVDLASGTVDRIDVGGPILALAFTSDGQTLFGVLDSSACAAATPCGGLFAVDLSHIAAPVLLTPTPVVIPGMLPGTLRGLAVGGAATITRDTGDPLTVTVNPLVVVSSSDGNCYLVDGTTRTVITNTVTGAPAVLQSYHLDPTGQRTLDSLGPATLVLDPAVAVDERITITYQGFIDELEGLTGTITDGTLTVTGTSGTFDFGRLTGAQAQDRLVLPGDLVVFGTPGPCAGQTVAVVSVPSATSLSLADVPPLCQGAETFSVRVGGSAYAVTGSTYRAMGRVLAGQSFSFSQEIGAADAGAVAVVQFNMGSGDPRRDAQYVIVLGAPEEPFKVLLATLGLPGAIAFDPKSGFFYVAFDGGNALVELRPEELRSGQTGVGATINQ